jgi:DNA-binding Xre family transcriptional regulator
MNASQVTFDRMMIYRKVNRLLSDATSFIQVEYGVAEVQACWDGFVDTSDNAGLTFKDLADVCSHFAVALTDYIEYLSEPSPLPLN